MCPVKTTSAHCTNEGHKLDAMKTVTENGHMDDSKWIHKYNNLLITKSNKKQTYLSLIRGTGGVYKVCTARIKDV